MTFQVVVDGSNQIRDVLETAAANTLVGNLSKPTLDQIQPRTRRRDEVEVEPGMSCDPGFDPRTFVGCVIVHDKMHIEMGWRLGIDLVEEKNEFLVSVAWHAVADHFAIEQAQRGEQCGGAVALVVVGHCPTAPLFDRQSWLGTIEGLDLAFLVGSQKSSRRIYGTRILGISGMGSWLQWHWGFWNQQPVGAPPRRV